MNSESGMEFTTKRVVGIIFSAILVISIYLSYDGFDQRVTGGNGSYTILAKLIGVILAVGFSASQFALNSRYEQLNPTLKLIGFASYVYSIYTNYLGAKHLLGMSDEMAWVVSIGMDIAPEPMIAWSLGDSRKGDLVGNIMKWVSGYQPKPQQNQQQQNQNTQPRKEEQKKGGGGNHQREVQRMSNMPFRDRRQNDEIMSKLPRENHKGRFE